MNRLFGRRRETEILERALDGAVAGSGGLVRIVGEPGVGKSALASALFDRAGARSLRRAWARAWERAAAVPYGILSDALSTLRGADARSGEDGSGPPVSGRPSSRDAVFAATRRALVDGAAPVLVVLDDIHAADLDSLELLLSVAPSLRSSTALVVASQRSFDTGATEEATTLLDALARVSSAIELGGLDLDAVRAMAEDLSGRPIDDRVAAAIHRATLGNALFVDGVLRRAVTDGALEEGSIHVPADVRRAILSRVQHAGPAVADALRVAAVVGRPFAAGLIAEATGGDPDAVETTLRVAADAGLLDASVEGTFAFRHTLVGDALTSSLLAGARADLHARVARAIDARDGERASPEELARHRAAAVRVVGLDAALVSIDRAVQHATAVFAHEEAVRHRRDGLALVETHAPREAPRRLAALIQLGDAWVVAGKRSNARERFVEAATLARRLDDPTSLARAALGVADTGEFGAIDREKIGLLEEAASRLDGTGHALAARVSTRLAAELWADPAKGTERRALSAQAVQAARASNDRAALFHALDARFQSFWGPAGRGERRDVLAELRELSRDLGQDDERASAIHRHALFLAAEDGDLDAFAAELSGLSEIAVRSKRPALDETVAQRRLLVALATGDLDLARRLLDEVRSLGQRVQNPQADMGHAFVSSLIAEDAGRVEDLAPCIDALRLHAARLPHLLFLSARLAACLALVGRTEEAARELDVVVARGLPALDDGLATMGSLALAADAARLLGDVAAAERIAPMLTPYADRCVAIGATVWLGSARHHAGLLASMLGDDVAAARLVELGHVDHQRARSPAWIARSERELALLANRNPREPGAAAPRPRERDRERASLVREGQGWELLFAAKKVQLHDAKGLRILATLLSTPRTDHHVLDLVGAAEIRTAGDGLGPEVDQKALAAYRRRIAALHEDHEDAESRGDVAGAIRARAELEALEDEVAKATGLGARQRATGAPERARVAVAKSLARTLATLEACHPEAHAHISRALRTGMSCSYDPDPASRVSWEISR